jgi:hypothetical protein
MCQGQLTSLEIESWDKEKENSDYHVILALF